MRHLLRCVLYLVLAVAGLVIAALAAFSWQADRREVRLAAEAAPPTGRFVKAADVSMFIQEAGPADGPAVLFVHGTGAWSETWRDSMSVLAKAGFRAIAIDLPPFGYSQRPDQPHYGKQQQGRRIIGVLDALQLRRAMLVGHSFGGGPTLEATLLAPDRIRALVLVDAALSIRTANEEAQPPSLLVRAVLGAKPLRDSVVATFLTNPSFTRRLLQAFIDDSAHATDERVAVYRQPLTVKGSTQAIGEWLPALLTPTGVSASEDPTSYKTLGMPVFVIWGGRDSFTPLAQGERLAAITPKAELLVMKQVGHIPQIEDARQFNELLLQCVGRLKLAP